MIEINLSSSALSSAGCLLSFKRTVIDGWCDVPSANIVYGEAVHKYIDTMYKTNGFIPAAIDAAVKTFEVPKIDNRKSPHLSDQRHMLTTALSVWEMWIKRNGALDLVVLDLPCTFCVDESRPGCKWCNGQGHYERPATELTFSFKYYEDESIRVNLCGTIDSIGKLSSGCYVIRDFKTTSSWDTKGYFYHYKLSKQLRFYRYALHLMGQSNPDSVLGQVGNTKVGCVIDALFIKPEAAANIYARSDVMMFSDNDMSEFKINLDNFIGRLSSTVKSGTFNREGILTGACEAKWGCPYTVICSHDEPVSNLLLEKNFKKRIFNPLNYSGV